MKKRTKMNVGTAAMLATTFCTTASAQCSQWVGIGGTFAGTNATVQTIVNWDPDGSGPLPTRTVIGGDFTAAGGTGVGFVAVWDGSTWNRLGNDNLQGSNVASLLVLPDNTLVAAGTILLNGTYVSVARYNTTTQNWERINNDFMGFLGSEAGARSLAFYNGRLYAAGSFAITGTLDSVTGLTVPVRGLASIDPSDPSSKWQPVIVNGFNGLEVGPVPGTSTSQNTGFVSNMFVNNGELIMYGSFKTIANQTVNRIVRYNGTAYLPLGGSNPGVRQLSSGGLESGVVQAGAAYTLNGNSGIVFGGLFNSFGNSGAAGQAANAAFWNRASDTWTAMGTALSARAPEDFRVMPDGTLYVGAASSTASVVTPVTLGRWNNATGNWDSLLGPTNLRWETLGSAPSVKTFGSIGNTLLLGGYFKGVNNVAANNIMSFDGTAFSGFVEPNAVNGTVQTFEPYGGNIVAGGMFSVIGGTPANGVAVFNGQTWSQLGGGVSGIPTGNVVNASNSVAVGVYSSAVIGNNLYIGGDFTSAGGVPVARVAVWNGTSFAAVGNGAGTTNGRVQTLVVHNGELYAAGPFNQIGGVSAIGVARFNASTNTWAPVGAGLASSSGGTPAVFTRLASYNGQLYANGSFLFSGGTSLTRLARFNAASGQWEAVPGAEGGIIGNAGSAALLSEPSGLTIGGTFRDVANLTLNTSNPAGGVATFTGSSIWSPLGIGFLCTDFSVNPNQFVNVFINSLARYGGTLLAGGAISPFFASDPPLPNVNGIGQFDTATSTWTQFGGNFSGSALDMTVYNGELWVGGNISAVGSPLVVSPFFARYTNTGTPWIGTQPAPATVAVGATATFTAAAASGYNNLTATWQLETAPNSGVYATLSNGPIPGTTSTASIVPPAPLLNPGPTTLTISGASAAVSSRRVRVTLSTASCGSVSSTPVLLTVGLPCYANCDGSTTPPVLGPADFSCFLIRFRAGDAYANCDGSTIPPVLGPADFSCFLSKFRAGCP